VSLLHQPRDATGRHGTTTVFAALEVATGKVTDACYPRHRGVEFLKFLKLIAKAYPRRQLNIVVDNYSVHNHADDVLTLANRKAASRTDH